MRLGLALGLVLTGIRCAPSSQTPSPPEVPHDATEHARAESPRKYSLVGQVVQLDRDRGIVTIRHEAIPDFMPAMTMPFTLENRAILEDLEVGDEVSGILVVGDKSSALEDLVVTRPAIAPPPVLDRSGSSPAIRASRQPLAIGEPVPDTRFITQDGTSLSLGDLRGQVIALTFIYTRCPLPEFCPRIDRKFHQLAELVRMLPEKSESRVRLLSVSFDPEHDTPDVLAKHASNLGARPPLWTFVTAEHEELAKLAEPLGLTYGPAPGEIVHNLVTAVIGPDGQLLRLEQGGDWEPEDLYRTIAKAVRDRLDHERPTH